MKGETVCTFCYVSFILLLMICIYLFMRVNDNSYSLDPFDLIKLYELGKNDSLASNTQVRKNNGETCGITSIFEDSKLKTTEKGDCLGKEETIREI
jgi:hypothetical protein